jgi:hypothetical protein
VKILLDHNPEHQVKSTIDEGWGALKNGNLLDEAQASGFEAILTSDKNIKHQQNLASRSISIIVLRAPNNALETHVAMLDEIRRSLITIQPDELIELFHPDMKS